MTIKRDSWLLGIILGMIVPIVVYALIMWVLNHLGKADGLQYYPNPKAPALAGLAVNLLAFRYYMVNLRFDKTGRGIILVSFVMVIAIFAFL